MTRDPDVAVAGLAAVTLGLVLAPVALNGFLPLEDLANHIARRHIMAAPADGPLAAYYSHAPTLGTNAAVDLVWRAAGRHLTDAITFSRLAVGGALAGFVLSVAILHRVLHGRWSAWPLAAALLVHNASLLWGFENFVVTVPLAILAIAAWIGLADRRPALRLAVTAAALALLYAGHVLALLAYVLFLTGWEAGRLRGGWRCPRWPELGLIGAVCLAHLGRMAAAGPAGYGSETVFGDAAQRLDLLLSPFGRPWLQAAPMPDGLVAQGPMLWAGLGLLSFATALRAGVSLRLAPGAGPALLLFGLVTLLMPAALSGVVLTQVRFPYLLLGLALAATDLRVSAAGLRAGLVALLVALVALRSFLFHESARLQSADIAGLQRLAAAVPAGARVLPVLGGNSERATLHWHSAAYLVPFSEAFVPTLFVAGSHDLALRPEWRRLSAPQPVAAPVAKLVRPRDLSPSWDYLATWEADYTHLLAIGLARGEMPPHLPLREIAREGGTALYVLKPPPRG